MDEQTRYPGYPRWAPWAAAALLSVGVGAAAYSLGAQQAAAAAGSAAWTGRHWHWGFFPFFPLMWLFSFWISFALIRGLGGWGWHRRRYYRGGYDAWYDDPSRWDEWHRRAHEQMKSENGQDPRR